MLVDKSVLRTGGIHVKRREISTIIVYQYSRNGHERADESGVHCTEYALALLSRYPAGADGVV